MLPEIGTRNPITGTTKLSPHSMSKMQAAWCSEKFDVVLLVGTSIAKQLTPPQIRS
jgi:hypothetical protein